MSSASYVAAVAAGLLALSSCGETKRNDETQPGPGESDNAPAAPSNSADFVSAYAHGYCTRLFRCFEVGDDFMGARLLLKTIEGCEAQFDKIEQEQATRRDLQTQLAAGALRFDATAAAKCIAELSVCNGLNSLTVGSCREVYEGSAQGGEACQRSEDCAGDAYCAESGECPGQCSPRKASGEICSYDAECSYVSGFAVCDRDATPSPVCRVVSRGPNAGLGEPCTRRLSADQQLNCNDELWCAIDDQLGAQATQGRCATPLAIGDSCQDRDDVCVGGFCDGTTKVCVQPVLRSKVGESCDESTSTECDPTLGLHCNEQGSCDASGDGSENSVCFSGDFQRGCDAGLYCARSDSAAGACTPLLAGGSACRQSAACESGRCNDSICEARYCGM